MTTLTLKETVVLKAFIVAGVDCNGSKSMQDLLDDNMTWMSASDLCKDLGWTKQEVGGVMSQLEAKGLICNSGESARGARDTDWYATDDGIKAGWDL